MGKHLYKLGLRKCYLCSEIKPLDSDNFRPSVQGRRGYRGECIPCKTIQFSEYLASVKGKNRLSGRAWVVAYFKNACVKCGLGHDNASFFDIDHIVPIKQGRGRRKYKKSEIGNYMLLCPNCHREKTIGEKGFSR